MQVLIFRCQYDQCFLRASSLTYYFVLSVVPVLAVMFGISKGFGLEKILEQTLLTEFHEQEEVIRHLISFGYSMLEQTRGGVIAGIGVLMLFFTVVRLLANIENSLNFMWGSTYGRSIPRKICDYLALLLICPIFVVVSSSLTVFVTAQFVYLEQSGYIAGQILPVALRAIALIPYLLSTALFTFLYMFMPNRKVHFFSAVLAGTLAGIAYQILQASYITIQLQISRTGAIYGSFAALPLFMVWLYFSWILFLIGAEIVVMHQERLWDPQIVTPIRSLTPIEKKIALLAITKACVDSFLKREDCITEEELSSQLKMPARLIHELISELINSKIVFHTFDKDQEKEGIVPAKSPDQLRISDVMSASEGENEIVLSEKSPMIVTFESLIRKTQKILVSSKDNVLIKDVHIIAGIK